ncbi:cadherin domain-containing protein [Microvirga sp. CF3062]|uniref:cadherin domain-containing protein n=1 Tax=Microvirga sp. CF3062 TaxID=3110182 RepID=UPI002E768966|nr:cadherin domain-containing protein [Microvirga sp. CF3062]MEE1656941.1 cadherin domain-containing protein [Microvirga sp. CF3062]
MTYYRTLIAWTGRTSLVAGYQNTIEGGIENDTLRGRDLADWIVAGAGDDTVYGGGNDDILYGQEGMDFLYGQDGNDILKGGIGFDWLDGGPGADILDGDGDTTSSNSWNHASYRSSTVGIVASLDPRVLGTGDAAGDTYINISGIHGSNFNDTLVGNELINSLEGYEGDDTLEGGGGGDSLLGGEGFNYVSYEHAATGVTANLLKNSDNTEDAKDDFFLKISGLIGSSYDDQLLGDYASNNLQGGAGADILDGNNSEDTLIGGAGNDTLKGGQGNDYLNGGLGADALIGGDGYDYADYSAATAAVHADLSGANNVLGESRGDTFQSVEGVVGSKYHDTLYGDAHANNLQGWLGLDRLEGDDGNDTLFGGAGNDGLLGESGDDVLQGDWGNDTLDGGGGFDRAYFSGKMSEYQISQDAGGRLTVKDTIADRDGTDSVADVDYLVFENANYRTYNTAPTELALSRTSVSEDTLATTIIATLSAKDAEDDSISYSLVSPESPFKIDGKNLILTSALDYETKASHTITVKATDSYGDSTTQTFTIDVLDVLESNDPKDPNNPNLPLTLWGTSRADRLEGHNANDVLYGQSGNDALLGNLGNDKLYGRAGKDVLNGGDGQDIFVFDTKLSKASKVNKANQDKIVDFKVVDDTLHLAKSVFKKLDKKGVLKASEFYQGTKAHDRDDNLIYNKKTGALYYDADGTGSQAQIQIATLTKNLKMTHKDFFVV